jgi:hypothetical protein
MTTGSTSGMKKPPKRGQEYFYRIYRMELPVAKCPFLFILSKKEMSGERFMNDLNMQFVREFFELNLFHVLTHWQHDSLARIGDLSSMLFVEHTKPEPSEAGFLLSPGEMSRIGRAVVEVRGWHADRFYPSVIQASPNLGHVAFDDTRELAREVLGCDDFTTILVISELPSSPKPRARALELLKDFGIGHILEFTTVLRDTLDRLSPQGNYAPSQTLETMRLLKRYRFITRQQLEFPFATEALPTNDLPEIETTMPPEEETEETEEANESE